MKRKVRRKPARDLSLRDRLSRLTYAQACRLLGGGGEALIQQGGKHEINIAQDVHVGDDMFRLNVDGATVLITLMSAMPRRLHWCCTRCPQTCAHVGAAFALVLEEKTALGLAAEPVAGVPVESLSEEELVAQALREREERARTEKMKIRATDAKRLWTDYIVTSALSGKSYRVALRGWHPGESYCSCPDFRKNTLGVCKHLLKVQARARRRFSASAQRRPYRPKMLAIHLRYGREQELRLMTPPRLSAEVADIVKPLRDRPIAEVGDLVRRISRLAALGHDVLIYPDAEEFIEQRLHQTRVQTLVSEIRAHPARHPLRKELLKAELLPYQMDGVAFAVGAGRAILADDMGLGKTIQGVGVAELLARCAGIRKVLVVCPASVKSQWRSEVRRFSERTCQIVTGSARSRAAQYASDCFFTICNYEQVLRDMLAIEPVVWDLIILDEGQRIKNWEAKTSRVIKVLRSPFALVLSGTPLENRLDELYSVAEFVDDRRLGPAFRFLNRHRVVDANGRVLGFKNLAVLRKCLQPILLRRTRASVMRDLPARTTEIMHITPTDEQFELHRNNLRVVSSIVRKAYISEMDLLRLRKALLLCRMSADSTFLVDKQTPAYSSKLDALDDLLGSLFAEEDRKAILFSEWTTMLNLIEPILKRRGLGFVRLDGSVPQGKRQQLVERFRTDADCRLFITTNAGSTGLNLQAANTVINVDLPWNPAVLEQRIGRAHRMGQKKPVQVYILVTDGTLEESLLKTLSDKHELALAALDAESTVDEVGLQSGIEELKRRLEVLVGHQPDAPVDESELRRQAEEGARLARAEQISEAAGQLFTAAFTFLGELLPEPADTPAVPGAVERIKQRLRENVAEDEQGRPRLTIALPDLAALDAVSESLARLLAVKAAGPAHAGRAPVPETASATS